MKPNQKDSNLRSNFEIINAEFRNHPEGNFRSCSKIIQNTNTHDAGAGESLISKQKNMFNKIKRQHNLNQTFNGCKKQVNSTKQCLPLESKRMLLPGKHLNLYVKRQLDFALDYIMTKIKQASKRYKNNMQFRDHTQKQFTIRKIRDLIRARILNVMMNKVIYNYKDVVEHYRKEFPCYLDAKVRLLIEDPSQPLFCDPKPFDKIVLPQEDKIASIFEKGIDRCLKDNFQEMINTLKNQEILDCIDELPNMEDLLDEDYTDSNKTSDNENKGLKMNELQSQIKYDTNKNTPHTRLLNEYYKIIDRLLIPRIGQYLQTYKEQFANILNNDKDFVNCQEKVIKELRDKVIQEFDAGNSLKSAVADTVIKVVSDDDVIEIIDGKGDTDDEIKMDTDDDLIEIVAADDVIEIIEIEDDVINNKIEIVTDNDKVRVVDKDNDIISIHSDSELKEDVIEKEEVPQVEISNGPSNKNAKYNGNVDKTMTSKISEDLLLRVKLLGYPHLPSIATVSNFLDKFKPLSIKKHKTIKNLLVVDFDNKEDYNKMLAANKSKVGNSIFYIKPNNDNVIKEKISVKQNKDIVNDNPKTVANKNDRSVKEKETNGPNEKQNGIERILKNEVHFNGNQQTSETVNLKNITSNNLENNSQFFALIIGRPHLPTKLIAWEFLKKFNPVSIRKHNTVPNVLLCRFNNRKDYDNILAANKSRVGDVEFVIKPRNIPGNVEQNISSSINKKSDNMLDDKKFDDVVAVVPLNKDKEETVETKEITVIEVVNNDVMVVDKSENELAVTTVENELQTAKKEFPQLSNKEVIENALATNSEVMEIDVPKEYIDANVRNMISKTIIETFTKAGQINKQTNYKLLKCTELEANITQAEKTAKDISVDVQINKESSEEINIANINDGMKQVIEDTFYRKLNILKDTVWNVLCEDEEYNNVKSLIMKNVENMNKSA